MNNKLSRREMIRTLRLAEAGKLTLTDLAELENSGTFKITLHLGGDQWTRPDGTKITIQEKQEECRKRGALFVTLDLS